jgi:hypothetical protein
MDETAAEFAEAILHGVSEVAESQPDLALELGLTAWMRQGGRDIAEAQSAMVALRSAILEVAEMDHRSEPSPLTGVSARTDLLNWAVYLADLVRRAARASRCETRLIVERSVRRVAA